MVRLGLLLLAAASACFAAPSQQKCDDGATFPLANNGTVVAHDPNIIKEGDYYYLFKGGVGVSKFRASSIDGPWKPMGSVLAGDSIIAKGNETRPWAPSVVKKGDVFYCFYSLSSTGSRDSAIGVATSDDIESNDWTDHGMVIETGTGSTSDLLPYRLSNAIDPQVFLDGEDGPAYLNYGSFWSGLWQVPLADDLLSVSDPAGLNTSDISYLASTKKWEHNAVEGVFMSYRDPYYYVWFSRGRCCHFDQVNNPDEGEYSIRVGRAESVHGPFFDRSGNATTEGGGHVVYASNHGGDVFAPGGLGVLQDGDSDILYYHYHNKNKPNGLKFKQAYLGYSYLEYEDGWPVASCESS